MSGKPEVVDVRAAEDPRDVIHRAVQFLAAGELVALPTETVYAVAAHSQVPAAIDKLSQAVGTTSPESRCLFAVKGYDEALDYLPDMSRTGRRLARRCWPGPVILGFEVAEDVEMGLFASLPKASRVAVRSDGSARFRVVMNDVFSEILKLVPAPLVVSAESTPDTPLATNSSEIIARFGDRIALVVDDGPCRYGQPSTLVRVVGNSWEFEQRGVVSRETMERLAGEVYLFVCTGNTCRSPMAEAVFRMVLSERLNCTEDELAHHGFAVVSAGIAAGVGAPASPESVEALERRGISFHEHSSQPLTARLLKHADHVYAMTASHVDMLLRNDPESADRVELLARDGTDVSDPIGGSLYDYERCLEEIERQIRAIVSEIQI